MGGVGRGSSSKPNEPPGSVTTTVIFTFILNKLMNKLRHNTVQPEWLPERQVSEPSSTSDVTKMAKIHIRRMRISIPNSLECKYRFIKNCKSAPVPNKWSVPKSRCIMLTAFVVASLLEMTCDYFFYYFWRCLLYIYEIAHKTRTLPRICIWQKRCLKHSTNFKSAETFEVRTIVVRCEYKLRHIAIYNSQMSQQDV